jgi:hypothetical protein
MIMKLKKKKKDRLSNFGSCSDHLTSEAGQFGELTLEVGETLQTPTISTAK